jgi:hypothetical protein
LKTKLIIFFAFCTLITKAQYQHQKDTGLYFYFTAYNFYLQSNRSDTGLLFLKFENFATDKQQLSPLPYKGEYEYGKFIINHKKKIIDVELYDDKKVKKAVEHFEFKNNKQVQNDTIFYNLTSVTIIRSREVIIPKLK